MAFKAGNNCAVKLGTATVVGMGTWEISGITTDRLESTAFGDSAKKFMTGLLDYGEINFSGLYDPADVTGQSILLSANKNNSKIASVRLYVDNTSYWVADVTTDPDSGMYVESISIAADKSQLMTITVSGKATGVWVLV